MNKRKISISKLLLRISVICFLAACIYRYNYEKSDNDNNVISKIVKEKQDHEQDQELELKLKCAGLFLSENGQNKIKKENLPSLEVYTPYDITNYKVMGQEGKLIKEGTSEKKSDTKLNSFLIEGATEEVTEIRLIGFDKKMKKLADQHYYIILN